MDILTLGKSDRIESLTSLRDTRAKHIVLCHHFIREAIQDKIIWVQHIPTAEMSADRLTKALNQSTWTRETPEMYFSNGDGLMSGHQRFCVLLADLYSFISLWKLSLFCMWSMAYHI
jgi:hypothetical protein